MTRRSRVISIFSRPEPGKNEAQGAIPLGKNKERRRQFWYSFVE